MLHTTDKYIVLAKYLVSILFVSLAAKNVEIKMILTTLGKEIIMLKKYGIYPYPEDPRVMENSIHFLTLLFYISYEIIFFYSSVDESSE